MLTLVHQSFIVYIHHPCCVGIIPLYPHAKHNLSLSHTHAYASMIIIISKFGWLYSRRLGQRYTILSLKTDEDEEHFMIAYVFLS